MDEKENAEAPPALPAADRPEVHQSLPRAGPISLEQDKEIRDGLLPQDRFVDDRMKNVPDEDRPVERKRTERGNRGPGEKPGFGQGA